MPEFLNFKRYKTKPEAPRQCHAAVVPEAAGISINFNGEVVEAGQVVIKYEDGKTEVMSKEAFIETWIPYRKSKKK